MLRFPKMNLLGNERGPVSLGIRVMIAVLDQRRVVLPEES